MEVSVKIAAGLAIIFISAGILIKEGGHWQQSQQQNLQKVTHLNERKLDENHYLHGYQFPKITAQNQQLAQNESYDPYRWVSAFDEQDGDLSDQIQVYGEVDTAKEGQYELRYEVMNSIGLRSSKKIKVQVR